MPATEYLNSLTPKQRKAATQLKALLQTPSFALKWRIDVGRLVERMVPSGSPERYGRNSMTGLLDFLGRPPHYQAELYAARQAASCFAYPDLPKLKGLRWCHLRWLVVIPDEKLRNALRMRCLKERWSCSRLSREIQSELGMRGRGGRRLPKPANFGPAVSLREMTRLAERWAICQPVWFDEARGRLRGSATASAVLQRDLEAALDKLQQLEELVPIARKAVEKQLQASKSRPGRRPKSAKPKRAK